jgi:hypothetical protein
MKFQNPAKSKKNQRASKLFNWGVQQAREFQLE